MLDRLHESEQWPFVKAWRHGNLRCAWDKWLGVHAFEEKAEELDRRAWKFWAVRVLPHLFGMSVARPSPRQRHLPAPASLRRARQPSRHVNADPRPIARMSSLDRWHAKIQWRIYFRRRMAGIFMQIVALETYNVGELQVRAGLAEVYYKTWFSAHIWSGLLEIFHTVSERQLVVRMPCKPMS